MSAGSRPAPAAPCTSSAVSTSESGASESVSAFVLPPPQAGRRVEQLRPRGADDEQRDARRPVDEMVDEVEQALVGPVEVLEDEDERALVGDPLEEAAPRRERLVLPLTPPRDVLDARQRAEVR